MKISEDSHDFILDEIVRGDALEYDPNRVYTADEVEEEEEEPEEETVDEQEGEAKTEEEEY